MIKKIKKFLTSIPATAVSGVFLILSLVLPKCDINSPVDPAWITVLISGLPLLYLAIFRLINNKGISKISSALLITIAMIAAILIGDLFAAGEVAFIMALGEILEDITGDRAKKGLKKLINLSPVTGRKITGSKEEIINAEDIKKDDIIRILPGETVPVDGIILNGETSIDQSVMTGESLPVDKTVGDNVFSGTLNRFGTIDIKATKVGSDSSLQKLIRMVKEAENKKAPMARTADKAASFLVPLALIIAVITGIVTQDIIRAVTVLVVFCPCALVLATPTAIMAAIGQATKHGVIIKSGEALEKMGKADTIAFDKTGTLTYGKLDVSDIISFSNDISENELLCLAASGEAKSEHPIGKAITDYAKKNNLELLETKNFKMSAGLGIFAESDGKKLLCGNEKLLNKYGINITEKVRETIEKLRNQGKATVLIAKDDEFIGIIALSDILRNESAQVIKSLKGMGINPVLLTGDNSVTAKHLCETVGINDIKAELMPEEKMESIIALQKENKTVCMIGDGVNDAPALKTADIGIAMGSIGSDIAVESADIAFISDDLQGLPYLKKLSVATVKTIKFSITLSMVINILAVLLSVMGVLNPTTGALVHNAGSCFVVLIAALLYDRKFK